MKLLLWATLILVVGCSAPQKPLAGVWEGSLYPYMVQSQIGIRVADYAVYTNTDGAWEYFGNLDSVSSTAVSFDLASTLSIALEVEGETAYGTATMTTDGGLTRLYSVILNRVR